MSETSSKIKPEVVAAISVALALYGYSSDKGYQATKITKCQNLWKKAGIIELMLGREINRDLV
ncbi:MAG TPA: hypothetical protein PL078_00095 [Bacillota bacterium]|jgi:hypothetical protein|nr:hypothetical protein [Peptococcaceae bacterium MAG4]NLW38238.1 hypothetical protein [Peptococcaceae bacterium]HPZ42375.1 hypothetical protein [Bacillota bacterium]HQD75041.1 hypothetical protein [Bacillota bacterium]HUM57598.1 hypothetical protein [Bacillota bacterium]